MVEQRVTALIGVTNTEDLGILDLHHFRRFALACGDARSVDEADEVPDIAPLMYLSGVLHWGAGPPEASLRIDGLARRDAPGVENEDVTVMHGGQQLTFHRAVRSGARVFAHRSVTEVKRREGRSGGFLAIDTVTRYQQDNGTALIDSIDTVLVLERR